MSRSPRQYPARSGHGFSLVEVIVAITIAGAFLAGALAAFVQILRSADRAEADMNAIANGRVAVDAMAVALKQANYFAGDSHFLGRQNPTPLTDDSGGSYGDGVDNDEDGQIDEEKPDGQDDDGDWVNFVDDRHAAIVGMVERPSFVGQPDLGDGHVDEDVFFEADYFEFSILPNPGDPNPRDTTMSFSLETFEGIEHTLVKRVIDGGGATVQEAPLAEGVLSFSVMYWQPNGSEHYWLTAWDSEGPGAMIPPQLPLPAAVRLSLEMYADDRPIEIYRPGQAVRVKTVSTIVNIEQVINDSQYPRP